MALLQGRGQFCICRPATFHRRTRGTGVLSLRPRRGAPRRARAAPREPAKRRPGCLQLFPRGSRGRTARGKQVSLGNSVQRDSHGAGRAVEGAPRGLESAPTVLESPWKPAKFGPQSPICAARITALPARRPRPRTAGCAWMAIGLRCPVGTPRGQLPGHHLSVFVEGTHTATNTHASCSGLTPSSPCTSDPPGSSAREVLLMATRRPSFREAWSHVAGRPGRWGWLPIVGAPRLHPARGRILQTKLGFQPAEPRTFNK